MDFESLNAELKNIGLVLSNKDSSIEIKTWWPKIASSVILLLVGTRLMFNVLDTIKISYFYFTEGVFNVGLIGFLITSSLGIFGIIAFIKGADRLIGSLGYKFEMTKNYISISNRNNLSLEVEQQHSIVNFRANVVGGSTQLEAKNNDGSVSIIVSEKNDIQSNQNTLTHLAEFLNTRL